VQDENRNNCVAYHFSFLWLQGVHIAARFTGSSANYTDSITNHTGNTGNKRLHHRDHRGGELRMNIYLIVFIATAVLLAFIFGTMANEQQEEDDDYRRQMEYAMWMQYLNQNQGGQNEEDEEDE
jgi:hypothetical protein